jgi:hypothetical protein
LKKRSKKLLLTGAYLWQRRAKLAKVFCFFLSKNNTYILSRGCAAAKRARIRHMFTPA